MEAEYPTDLTDSQWQRIGSLVPSAKPGGRPRNHSSRELLNAMLNPAANGGCCLATFQPGRVRLLHLKS